MNSYPLISEHGLIGDLQTAALSPREEPSTGCACPIRLTERVRIPVGCRSRRAVPDRARGHEPHRQAAVLSGHRRADHALHVTRRRRRGRGLHAGRRSPPRLGSSPADPGPARRPRTDDVHPRVPTALRLREGRAPTPCGRGRLHLRDRRDGPRTARHGRAPAGRERRARAMDDAAGDVGGAILESGADREAAAPIDAERVLSRFNETVRFWRGWLGRSTYTVAGVRRSAAPR